MGNAAPVKSKKVFRAILTGASVLIVCFALIYLPVYYQRRLHSVKLTRFTRPVVVSWPVKGTTNRRSVVLQRSNVVWNRTVRLDTAPSSMTWLSLQGQGDLQIIDKSRLSLFPGKTNWFFLKYGKVLFSQKTNLQSAAQQRWPAADAIKVSASSQTVEQGKWIRFSIDTAPDVVDLIGYFQGQRLDFITNNHAGGRSWSALQGVDVGVKPGIHYLYIRGVDSDGNWVLKSYPVKVARKVYGVYRKPASKATKKHKQKLTKSKWWKKWQKKKRRVLSGDAPRKEYRMMVKLRRTFTPCRMWGKRFYRPVRKMQRISSVFGLMRYLTWGRGLAHRGIDYASWSGTPVYAAAAGRVIFAAKTQVRGNLIVIDHGLGLLTIYMHLKSIRVKKGDQVDAGNRIGSLGTTGLSTGPHLHFEMRLGGVATDPNEWFKSSVADLNHGLILLKPGE